MQQGRRRRSEEEESVVVRHHHQHRLLVKSFRWAMVVCWEENQNFKDITAACVHKLKKQVSFSLLWTILFLILNELWHSFLFSKYRLLCVTYFVDNLNGFTIVKNRIYYIALIDTLQQYDTAVRNIRLLCLILFLLLTDLWHLFLCLISST